MDILQKLSNCSYEEIEDIVKEEVRKQNNASQDVNLGIIGGSLMRRPHKGFISKKSKIKFSSNTLGVDSYNMDSEDYIIDFAKIVFNCKLDSKGLIIQNLATFINQYFGELESLEDKRSDFLTSRCRLDEEGFALEEDEENISIEDFKGVKLAQCTEKAAITQNILSLFGFESYFCCGAVKTDSSEEFHSFNVVAGKNKTGETVYRVVDTSLQVPVYNANGVERYRRPYVATIPTEDFQDFIDGKKSLSFSDYIVTSEGTQHQGTRYYGINMDAKELIDLRYGENDSASIDESINGKIK